MEFYGRTDLAAEAHRLWQHNEELLSTCPGIRAEHEQLSGCSVSCVEILDENGEALLHMPAGRYYTVSLPPLYHRSAPDFSSLVSAISALIRRCLPEAAPSTVLIVALGNPDITPDAVGPLAAQHILVTRHLKNNTMFHSFCSTSLCRTGVLGTTGMESALQIRSLCSSIHPDCLIVIDALAGVDPEGLCRSVQISDAGIAPGSGVGNDREAISERSMGIPVVSIGVPTVVDAASLTQDDTVPSLFVTPRDIDVAVRQLGRLLGYGVNAALHPSLSIADMELLLE